MDTAEKRKYSIAQRSVFTRVILYSLLISTTAYIHSSYMIAAGLSQSQINSVYIGMSICGIIGVWFLSLKKRSIASFVTLTAILTAGLTLALAVINSTLNPHLLIPAIFLLLSMEPALFFIFDELLEHVTDNSGTSKTRSLYLTFQNTSWIIAPLIGFILIERYNNLDTAYIVGLILSVILFLYNLYSSKHTSSEQVTVITENKPFNKHIIPALFSHFFLQVFYSVMITVAPIFMHEHLHWSWSQVGITIALALCAFPLVQLPLGRFLVSNAIEKQLMPLSLLVIGLALLVFTVAPQGGIVIIPMIAFFLSRVGTATLELSNESYIFRHIDYKHRANIALFRSLSPLAYLLVPIYWYLIKTIDIRSFMTIIGVFTLCMSIVTIGIFTLRDYFKKIRST